MTENITLAAALAKADDARNYPDKYMPGARNGAFSDLIEAVRSHLAQSPRCSAADPGDLPGGYTRSQLEAAWALTPKDAVDWKRPIDGRVPDGADLEAMSAAIAFFCGSPSEFTPDPGGGHLVHAPGFHMCIGS